MISDIDLANTVEQIYDSVKGSLKKVLDGLVVKFVMVGIGLQDRIKKVNGQKVMNIN